jgi:hypothetical protein
MTETWHARPRAGNTTASWTDDGSLTGLAHSLGPLRFCGLLEPEFHRILAVFAVRLS